MSLLNTQFTISPRGAKPFQYGIAPRPVGNSFDPEPFGNLVAWLKPEGMFGDEVSESPVPWENSAANPAQAGFILNPDSIATPFITDSATSLLSCYFDRTASVCSIRSSANLVWDGFGFHVFFAMKIDSELSSSGPVALFSDNLGFGFGIDTNANPYSPGGAFADLFVPIDGTWFILDIYRNDAGDLNAGIIPGGSDSTPLFGDTNMSSNIIVGGTSTGAAWRLGEFLFYGDPITSTPDRNAIRDYLAARWIP